MKARFLALLALVLGLASCQTEPEGLDVMVGGDGNATISVVLPEDAITRAGGTNSAESGLANKTGEIVRVVMRIYDENGRVSDKRYVDYLEDGDLVANFDVRLVPDRDYTFVAWADQVDAKKDEDKYFDTQDLSNVTFKANTWTAMEEARDAYTATEKVEDFNSSKSVTLKLTRPFAKLRVVTTDIEALEDLNIEPKQAKVDYTVALPNSFNAVTGKVGTTTETKSFPLFDIAEYTGDTEGSMTLFADYILVPESGVVKFTMEVNDQNNGLIKANAFTTDIAIKRNNLTTIAGNILTDGKNVNVEVKPGFGEDDTNYSVITSAVELLRAIGTSGNYIVGSNITVTEADVVAASKLAVTRSTTSTTTINLNGYTITIENKSTEPLVTLDENEKVVFAGDGAIVEGANNQGDFIDNSATGAEVVFGGAEYDEEVFTGEVTDYVSDLIAALAQGGEYTLPADIIVKQPLTLAADKSFELDLNGKTLSAISTKVGANYNVFDVRGNLTVKNGNIKYEHKGENMSWNYFAEIFYVGFNGTLNLDGVNAENLGGSDMAYCIDMVNATNITVNVTNSTLKSTYIPVRVFNNSKTGVNNVTINESTLEGKYCFWVQYWLADGRDEATLQKTLKLDIYNSTEGESNNNTFIYTKSAPVLYGFDEYAYINEFGEQIVYDATCLQSIANFVNSGYSFKGETIKLAADIDLNNEIWTAIGTPEANFCGTFDGCDYTIKNLKILVTEGKEDKAYLGLFGYAKDATIKNVVFENVDINVACLDIDHSQGHIGAVAGSLEGTSTIENVTVKGDVKVEATFDANGASRVAVVAGGNSYGNVTMKNVHVEANEGSYLKANNNTGALAGQLQGKSVFENCSSNIDVTVNKFFAGGIIGLAAGDQTFTNCHTTGNIAVVAGREGRAHDQYRVGGIAGGWADGKNNVCTLVNCSYTGNVSGKNSDGSVANPLDYMGYVGRGYTLNGCQGSTVIIDGIRYVQKYDSADKAGIYDVTDAEGNVVVSTFAELEAAAKAGGNIVLGADIEFTKNIAVTNANFTLNGKDHKITQAESFNNPLALIDITNGKIGLKNVKFDGIKEGAVVRTVNAEINIDNITAKNCKLTKGQGLLRLLGKSSVTNSTFIDNECLMVISLNYDGENNDPQVVDNCVFENNTCNMTAVVYYVTGASGTINGNKFIGNTVNCEGNGATVYMGFQENCTVTNNLFQNNTVNEAGTSSRVAGGVFFGYDMVLKGNAFIGNDVTGTNAVAKDVCVSTYYTSIDLSGNYWGGNAPVENVNYFVQHKSDERSVIVNDYLSENPIK